MIVRTYGRRTRSASGRGLSDLDADAGDGAAAADFGELLPFSSESQDGSQDRAPDLPHLAAFSSQDSSPWSLDPDLLSDDPLPPSAANYPGGARDGGRKEGFPGRSSSCGGREGRIVRPRATATLMEAQEFGEMMEHLDEVNFALDGLRPGKPMRIRRASLLSLLTICGTVRQRRLLRAHGLAKRIVEATLVLSLDDPPCNIAAAALFYVLASDIQDDQLLDSPPCILFLLKLLNPPTNTIEDKTPSMGCRLLGISKTQTLNETNNGTDSSSKEILSKVQEILFNCKEIKPASGTDDGARRPELNSKWIALLTMEKACLSAVSFEDTCDMVKRVGGKFKERLRELGGLDAIFDVFASCHSTLEGCTKETSPISKLKDGTALQSVALFLKCLKIMENATFLSKDNQNHLLKLSRKIDSRISPLSFVGSVISAVKFLSELYLIQNSFSALDGQEPNFTDSHLKENWRGSKDATTSGDYDACKDANNSFFQKRQKLTPSQCGDSHTDLQTISSGNDVCSIQKQFEDRSFSCNVEANGSLRDRYSKVCTLRAKINVSGTKVNSIRSSNGWISIKSRGLERNSATSTKKTRATENDSSIDSFDPYAFDVDELEPSKWELLSFKTETTQRRKSTVRDRAFLSGNRPPDASCDIASSQITTGGNHQLGESSHCTVEEDSNLLEDCLLTSIKVLMNLTNDNPAGCQQIAACGGLDTMASLITKHFPSFDLCFHANNQAKQSISYYQRIEDDQSMFSRQSTDASGMSNRQLSDHELDFLVAILGLLVNLVEKNSQNRAQLASARVSVDQPGKPGNKEIQRDVIPLLCSIFLANQGAGEVAAEEKALLTDDGDCLMQGQREAEMMIVEAYSALLLAFLSTESTEVRDAIAGCLPNSNLQVLVPVLERFVAFHMSLNMISPETHSTVIKVIESCKRC